MMTMTKFRFIDSLKDERKKDEDIVKTTITKVMILKFKELLINTKMFLTLMNKTMMKTKQD